MMSEIVFYAYIKFVVSVFVIDAAVAIVCALAMAAVDVVC